MSVFPPKWEGFLFFDFFQGKTQSCSLSVRSSLWHSLLREEMREGLSVDKCGQPCFIDPRFPTTFFDVHEVRLWRRRRRLSTFVFQQPHTSGRRIGVAGMRRIGKTTAGADLLSANPRIALGHYELRQYFTFNFAHLLSG